MNLVSPDRVTAADVFRAVALASIEAYTEDDTRSSPEPEAPVVQPSAPVQETAPRVMPAPPVMPAIGKRPVAAPVSVVPSRPREPGLFTPEKIRAVFERDPSRKHANWLYKTVNRDTRYTESERRELLEVITNLKAETLGAPLASSRNCTPPPPSAKAVAIGKSTKPEEMKPLTPDGVREFFVRIEQSNRKTVPSPAPREERKTAKPKVKPEKPVDPKKEAAHKARMARAAEQKHDLTACAMKVVAPKKEDTQKGEKKNKKKRDS